MRQTLETSDAMSIVTDPNLAQRAGPFLRRLAWAALMTSRGKACVQHRIAMHPTATAKDDGGHAA